MVNTRIQALRPDICPGRAVDVLDTCFTQLAYVIGASCVSVPDFQYSISPKLHLVPQETISGMDIRPSDSTCPVVA